MKDAVLFELANRWEHDANEPQCEDGSPEAAIGNAKAAGRREGLRECADGLRILTQLIGDSGNRRELAKLNFESSAKRTRDVLKA